MAAYSVGIDVGGTFTDCFVTDGVHGWRGKAPTTPRAPLDGLLAALADAAAAMGVSRARVLGDTVHFGLGTTVVTNCLAELAGSPTGLVATEGFADLWPMARGHRLGVDGMSRPLPTLVPRRRIAEVRERIDRDGAVLVPLDEGSVLAAADRLVRTEGVESLAVCLLWSCRNPAHERRVAAIVRERYPDVVVSCSSDLVPVVREYERMTATVLNAYAARSCTAFLDTLESRLAGAGLRVPVALMQSSGGTVAPGAARVRPILLAQSGPVAGVAAAEALAATLGLPEVITGDMGGTSFDVAVIHGGCAERRLRAEVQGLATALSTVAVASIGAGGGSLGWRDVRGLLRVGPRSAGADPGPACYGRGGTEPALTDALVALGLLDPGNFLGGRMRLDGEGAVAALARLGRSLGLDTIATARGMYRLALEEIGLAVHGLLVERGLDPRRFAFICYGGCGPLFGASMARRLGLRRVIVPALAAVFSALGAATADVRREVTRSVLRPLPADGADLAARFTALEAEVGGMLAAECPATEPASFRREADLRFRGQTCEVSVPFVDADGIRNAFRTRYAELYGSGALAAAAPVELVNCRVIGTARLPRPALAPAPLGPADASPARRGARAAWLDGGPETRAVAVYDGEGLRPGMALTGPALIERRDTTILVPPGDGAVVDGWGSLVIEVARA